MRLEAVFGLVEGLAVPKSIHVSSVGSTAWEKIQRKAGLTVRPYNGSFAAPELEQPPKFGWDDRLERAQAERYMPYLSTYLPFSKQAYQLVDAANNHPNMLSVSGLVNELGYEISGTTDVAIVLRRAAQINQPANGLRIVFELRKKRDDKAHFQAMVTLLLSNLLSGPLKPIVILTNLGDEYTFYWLDGRTIFYCPSDSSGIALGIIKSFLQQEEVTAVSEVEPVQVCFALRTLLCCLCAS